MNRNCDTCKYFNEDWSVGYRECLNDDITDEELNKYFTINGKGCLYWEYACKEK